MDFPNLQQYSYFGFDTETTGLIFPTDRVFGFSITTPDKKSQYWDIRKTPKVVAWFNAEMRKYKGQVWAHNMPFDYSMSAVSGLNLRPIMDRGALNDTCMQAVLLDEHLFSYKLDDLGLKYLKIGKEDIWKELAALYGGLATKNVQIPNLQRAPAELVGRYCNKDSLLVVLLKEWQDIEIESQAKEDVVEGSGIRDILRHEKRWMPMFIKRKMEGVRVDVEYAVQAADKLQPLIDEAQKKLNKLSGFGKDTFNVNSSPQIRKLFEPQMVHDNKNPSRRIWQANDGTIVGTTAKGQPSFGADFLREMNHPAAAEIQDIRSLIKTRDTFLLGHVVAHSHGGRVFPNINQNKGEDGGTGTGRLSYSGPALQQIPNRNKKVAAIVKPCFLPEEGHIWVDSDMASFEVRVFAHLTNVQRIIDEYHKNPNLDLHAFTGELTNLPRDPAFAGQPNAKQLNLSMIFNQGKGSTAAKMGMSWEWNSFEDNAGNEVVYQKAGPEAEAIIAKYHSRLPGVKRLADGCKAAAEHRGFIFTKLGRRIRFPHGWKSYKASGLLIQSTSADLNKENWQICDEQLEGEEGKLLLNTHDSYGFSLPEGSWEKTYGKIAAAIQKPRIRVPLILELSGKGKNWWEAIS